MSYELGEAVAVNTAGQETAIIIYNGIILTFYF